MNTEYLKYFIAACEHGSILEASKTLYISAQGLGQGIRRLEHSLGVELLESSYNGVRPTEFGEQFYRQALVASKEYDNLEKMAADYLEKIRQKLIFGTIGHTKFYLGILDCINKYKKNNPETKFDPEVRQYTYSDELTESVRNGSVDVGLMFHSSTDECFSFLTLSDYSPLVLAVSKDHPLAEKRSLDFQELKDLPLVVAANKDPFTDLLQDLCRQHGFEPNIIFYSTENSYNARLLDGNICAMMLRESYETSILSFCSNSICVKIQPEIPIAFSLFWRNNYTFDHNCQPFMEMLVDYFRLLIQ